jgi:hypothetical protein
MEPSMTRLTRYACLSFVVSTAVWVGAFDCARAGSDVVVRWNKKALEAMSAQKWSTVQQARALAIMELAVFDAVNAVRPAYRAYAFADAVPGDANEEAAASEAAFRVLAGLAPELSSQLETENVQVLGGLPDGPAKDAGVAVGVAAASRLLKSRQDDGYDPDVSFVAAAAAPGVYQPTSSGPMISPHFAKMRPFSLISSGQFRLPPPPPLGSDQVLRDLAEVRAIGSAKAARSPEQAETARFHVPPGLFPWNDIGRQMVAASDQNVLQSARSLALLAMAVSDGLSAGFDSKYTYAFWRPSTAIKAGGEGYGHPEIAADPGWTPFIPSPLHPEYPCMHCTIGSAAVTVLEGLFPQGGSFQIEQGGVTRHYDGFRAYVEEEAESRVAGGVHFRWSVLAGEVLGTQVGRMVRVMLPKR